MTEKRIAFQNLAEQFQKNIVPLSRTGTKALTAW